MFAGTMSGMRLQDYRKSVEYGIKAAEAYEKAGMFIRARNAMKKFISYRINKK